MCEKQISMRSGFIMGGVVKLRSHIEGGGGDGGSLKFHTAIASHCITVFFLFLFGTSRFSIMAFRLRHACGDNRWSTFAVLHGCLFGHGYSRMAHQDIRVVTPVELLQNFTCVFIQCNMKFLIQIMLGCACQKCHCRGATRTLNKQVALSEVSCN